MFIGSQMNSKLNDKRKAITQRLGVRVFLAEGTTRTKALRHRSVVCLKKEGKKTVWCNWASRGGT